MHAHHPADLEPRDSSLKTVEITCEIICTIAELEEATVAAIAQELDYSKSVVFDHVHTLMANQLAIRYDEDNPTCVGDPPGYPIYELSLSFLELGNHVRRQICSNPVVTKQLTHLARETGEYVHFAAPEYGQTVYLTEERGGTAIDIDLSPGSRDPLYSTAFGKAVLSRYDEEDVRDPEIVTATPGGGGFDRIEELFESVQEARRRGYAVDDEETRSGVRAIASPVTLDGRVVGAIGLSGPATRVTDGVIEDRLASLVTSAAQTVEVEAADES